MKKKPEFFSRLTSQQKRDENEQKGYADDAKLKN